MRFCAAREKFWKAQPPKELVPAALWMDDAATREADADAPPVPLVAMNHCALGVTDLNNMAKCAHPHHAAPNILAEPGSKVETVQTCELGVCFNV